MPARIDYVNLAAAAATFKWPAIVVLRRRAGARSVVRPRGRREPTRSPRAPLYAPAGSPVARVVDLLCSRSRTNGLYPLKNCHLPPNLILNLTLSCKPKA